MSRALYLACIVAVVAFMAVQALGSIARVEHRVFLLCLSREAAADCPPPPPWLQFFADVAL